MKTMSSTYSRRKTICFTDQDIADLNRLHEYIPTQNTSECIRMIFRKGVEAYDEERLIEVYNSIAEDIDPPTEYVKSRRGRQQDW